MDEETFKELLDMLYEKTTEKMLLQIFDRIDSSDVGTKIMKSLIKNGCPPSAIMSTILEMAPKCSSENKKNSKDEKPDAKEDKV